MHGGTSPVLIQVTYSLAHFSVSVSSSVSVLCLPLTEAPDRRACIWASDVSRSALDGTSDCNAMSACWVSANADSSQLEIADVQSWNLVSSSASLLNASDIAAMKASVCDG